MEALNGVERGGRFLPQRVSFRVRAISICSKDWISVRFSTDFAPF
jgi:hypothetical protein